MTERPDPKFALMADKLEAIKRAHLRDLNRALFEDGSGSHVPLPTIPWWWSAYWRVRWYLVNLWNALRGRSPFYDEEDDGY